MGIVSCVGFVASAKSFMLFEMEYKDWTAFYYRGGKPLPNISVILMAAIIGKSYNGGTDLEVLHAAESS